MISQAGQQRGTALILSLRVHKQTNLYEFEAGIVYIVHSWIAITVTQLLHTLTSKTKN